MPAGRLERAEADAAFGAARNFESTLQKVHTTMDKQQSRRSSTSHSADAEQELTPTGLLAFLLFALPIILIVLCEIFDFPGAFLQ
jgi:cation transport ATPase